MASTIGYQNFAETQDKARLEVPSSSHSVDTMSQPQDRKVVYKNFVGHLGEAEIVDGILCCILGCISILLSNGGPGLSSGLWAGVFPFITGISGLIARHHPTSGRYIFNTVLAMISSVLMIVLLIINITMAVKIHKISEESDFLKSSILYILLCILALIALVLCITNLMLGLIVLLCNEVNYVDPVFFYAGNHGQVVLPLQLGSIDDLKNKQESQVCSLTSSKLSEEHAGNIQSVVTVDSRTLKSVMEY